MDTFSIRLLSELSRETPTVVLSAVNSRTTAKLVVLVRMPFQVWEFPSRAPSIQKKFTALANTASDPAPLAVRVTPDRGDGLTIAYHGLNLGRVALCANAAGTMRLMMASMIPWAKFRKTYGEPIARRELVRRRLGRLAGLIVASDALVAWCSTLIDEGYRGEMECIVAKVFGSEAQKEAAIELTESQEFHIDFWREFTKDLQLDDPGQPVPNTTKGMNLYFAMPPSSSVSWISAGLYHSRNPQQAGVYLA